MREIAKKMFPDHESFRQDTIMMLDRQSPQEQYKAAVEWKVIQPKTSTGAEPSSNGKLSMCTISNLSMILVL